MFKTKLHFLLLFLITFIIFGNSLFFNFVWDDTVLYVDNEVYQSIDIGKFFLSPANGHEYQPFRDLSYAIDYKIWGWNPVGFHLTNIILYFINLAFIYIMTRKITISLLPLRSSKPKHEGTLVALLTALFFAVNPLQSESVSWVSGRNVILSGMFFFVSCYFYVCFLSGKKYFNYYAAFFCFLFALFSKATVIILPLVFISFLLLSQKSTLKSFIILIPFFLLSGIFFFVFKNIAILHDIIQEELVLVYGSLTLSSRIAVAFQIPFFYLKKLILPIGLSPEYFVEFSRSLWSLKTISATFILSAGAILAFIFRKKIPHITFAIMWFIICLLPALNLFLTNPVVADRYVYLSSYAFAYLLAVISSHYYFRKGPIWAVISALMIITVHSMLLIDQNKIWQSEESLMSEMILRSPNNKKGYVNLGSYYYSKKDYKKAFELFTKVKELDQSNTALEYYRSHLAFNEGRFSDAVSDLKYCITLEPYYSKAWNLLGNVYEKMDMIDLAINCYRRVLENGTSKEKFSAEKRLILLKRKIEPRFNQLRKQLRSDPENFNIKMQLAFELQKAGFFDEALNLYKDLINHKVFNWQAHYNMGLIYRATGETEAEIEQYQKSLSFNKNFYRAYNDLGLAYKKLKEYDLAVNAFKKAISIDKTYSHPVFNLARLYFQMGDKENSYKYFSDFKKSFPQLAPMTAQYFRLLNLSEGTFF